MGSGAVHRLGTDNGGGRPTLRWTLAELSGRGFKDNVNNMSHLLQGLATAHGKRLHQQQHYMVHQLNNTNPPNVTTEAWVSQMEDRSKVKRQLTTLTRSIKTHLHLIQQRYLGSYLHVFMPFPLCLSGKGFGKCKFFDISLTWAAFSRLLLLLI